MIDYLDEKNMELKILDERLKQFDFAPQTPGSAGYDLRACVKESFKLLPGEVKVVMTGVALRMNNPNLSAKIYARSGAGSRGLVLANGTGLIDSDFQGEIRVVLFNRTRDYSFTIEPMDRIAQMVFERVYHPTFQIVEQFTAETGRGGLGSTGR